MKRLLSGLVLSVPLLMAADCSDRQDTTPTPKDVPPINPSAIVAREGDLCSPEGAMATTNGGVLLCIKWEGAAYPTWRRK